MPREYKVHAANKPWWSHRLQPLCNVSAIDPKLTEEPSELTCQRCRIMKAGKLRRKLERRENERDLRQN